jgi:hypothetical protein
MTSSQLIKMNLTWWIKILVCFKWHYTWWLLFPFIWICLIFLQGIGHLQEVKKASYVLKMNYGLLYVNRWKFATNWTDIYLFSTLLLHNRFALLVALTFSFFWCLLLRLICNTHQLKFLLKKWRSKMWFLLMYRF